MHSPLWGFSAGDLTVVAVYFLAVLGIAWIASHRVKNREDFFLGGRKFGKLIQTFAAFGQATSVESITVLTVMVSANGAAGIWALLASGLLSMPVFWMTAAWYRRMRVLTLADFFAERYGSPPMAAFYTVCQVGFFLLVTATGLTAFSKTVVAIAAKPVAALTAVERAQHDLAVERATLEHADYAGLGAPERTRLDDLRRLNPQDEFSYVNPRYLIVGVSAITLLYANAGGLAAAFVTDLVQGSLILILTGLMVPFAAGKLNDRFGTSGVRGVFDALHRAMPDSFFDLWGSPTLPEFTWYWILTFSLVVVANTMVQANQLTTCGAAKDDHTARHGFVLGLFLKRYAMLLWGFLAILIVALYGTTTQDADYVWGHATRDLFAPVGFALVGLVVASLLAALMASKSAMLLTTSALVTQSIYRPLVRARPESHYVAAARWFAAGYVVASTAAAITFHDVFGLFKLMMTFNAILAATFLLGVVWRRANRWGAWASMGIMFIATVVLPFGLPALPGIRERPGLQKTTAEIRVVRRYEAGPADVVERAQVIAAWAAHHDGTGADRPRPLHKGERFEKTFLQPGRSVFWTDGVENKGGGARGLGQLKVELVALDWIGWDLARNSYALNETLSLLFRLLFPLLIVVAVSLATKPEDPERLAQFFGKMLTPVRGSAEDDSREMELTRRNPERFDGLKLLGPLSAWENRRWDREDWRGVVGCMAGVLGVVFLLELMVSVGQ
jgi:SSS family solute:Na+ symporter